MARADFEKETPPAARSMGTMEKYIAGILVLLTLALTLLFTIGEGLIHRNPKAKPAAPAPAMVAPTPMEPPALAALEAFFEAPDLASKAALVRDSARVRPMMEDFHKRRGHPFPTLGRVSPGRAARFDETPMVLFEVEPFSGPRYPVAVVWDGQRFAVDWESLTAYGSIDWSEFVEKQPAAAHTLRVFIQTASEAQQMPGIPTGYEAFRIGHRDDPQAIAAIGGAEVAAILDPLVENRRVPVTLEIAWKPLGPGGTPVPEILRMVAPKWSP